MPCKVLLWCLAAHWGTSLASMLGPMQGGWTGRTTFLASLTVFWKQNPVLPVMSIKYVPFLVGR